jgi:predicted esterase
MDGNSNNIYIGGLAKGGCIALAAYLQFDKSLGGVVCCNGLFCAELEWDKIRVEQKSETPILIYHGLKDKEIPYSFAESSYLMLLRENDIRHYDFEHDISGSHKMSQSCTQLIGNFFTKHITKSKKRPSD